MQTINIDEETKKIRLEYQLYELCDEERTISTSCDDVLVYLIDSMAINDDKRRELEEQNGVNERNKSISNVFRKASRAFGLKESSFYDEDSEFIAWQLRMLDGYHNLLSIAAREVNEDNYEEMFRLCRFAYNRYCDNAESVEELRRINLLASEGTSMERTLRDEDSLFCELVFNEELNGIISNSKGTSLVKQSSAKPGSTMSGE